MTLPVVEIVEVESCPALLVNGVEIDPAAFARWAEGALETARIVKHRAAAIRWQRERDACIQAVVEREQLSDVRFLPSYPYRIGSYPCALGRSPSGMPRVICWRERGDTVARDAESWEEVGDGPELVGRVYRGRTWYERGETDYHITEWRLKS